MLPAVATRRPLTGAHRLATVNVSGAHTRSVASPIGARSEGDRHDRTASAPHPYLEPEAKELCELTDPHPRIYEVPPEKGREILQ